MIVVIVFKYTLWLQTYSWIDGPLQTFKKSLSEVFLGKGVLKIVAKQLY